MVRPSKLGADRATCFRDDVQVGGTNRQTVAFDILDVARTAPRRSSTGHGAKCCVAGLCAGTAAANIDRAVLTHTFRHAARSPCCESRADPTSAGNAGHPSIAITLGCTCLTIIDLEAIHKRFQAREQDRYGGTNLKSDQSDPVCMENSSPGAEETTAMTKRKTSAISLALPRELLGDIRALIESARQRAIALVNSELTLLFWRIGRRIHTEVLAGERAGYGEQIVSALAAQLTRDHGDSFAEKNLRRMVQFATTFAEERIVVTLSRQLSWSHFVALVPLKDPLQREYYAQMCSAERWSVRTLRGRIDSMLYERTALSRQPDALITQELATMQDAQPMSPSLVMRDPYVLDFLGLRDTWQESDLEGAIVREMESFLLELGAGFTFVTRQKRIQLDGDDFYLDLLFYNRKLRRLVAVELKVGEFKVAYKGQMELYLRWLDKYEREPEEASPLGVILCTGKKSEQIELLELDRSGIHVAEYLTTLPPRTVLIERLEQATNRARLQIAQRASGHDHH
jgi:predicted nuclease of restriction endonuclease-like (RecB) superfamily